jgi:tetratricopeptide (TPR) repeat protein
LCVSTVAAFTKESAFFIIPALALATLIFRFYQKEPLKTALPPLALTAGLLPALLMRAALNIHASPGVVTALRQLPRCGSHGALHNLVMMAYGYLIPSPVVFRHAPHEGGSLSAFAAIIIIALLITAAVLLLIYKKHLAAALLTAWIAAGIALITLVAASGAAYSQRYLTTAPALILLVYGLSAVIRRLYSHLPQNASGRVYFAGMVTAFVTVLIIAYAAFAFSGTATCRNPVSFFSGMQKSAPNDIIAIGALAESLCEADADGAEIEKQVHRATMLNHRHPQVTLLHNLVIKHYLGRADFTNALNFCDWSLSLFPEDADKIALRAVALAELKRYPEALNAIENAITRNPENPAYLTLRGQIRANSKKQELH